MIVHGRKQISEMVYARRASEGGGAVRLTNMIHGAQVVFGGLEPDVHGWRLSLATKQAILAAFGVDGTAVINATNAYLNGIAASDRDKATALAGFINEDPMMVCSLGLEPQGVTMPIRWLVGDGTAYIDSGYSANNNSGIYAKFKTNSASRLVIGAWAGSSQGMLGIQRTSAGVFMADYGNSYLNYGDADDNMHEMLIMKNVATFDGDTKTATPQTFTAGVIIVFGFYRGGILFVYPCEIALSKVWDNGTLIRQYIPFISPMRDGMIDLANMEFSPNQGTGHFTDAYTLQDGVTPWTPLNQTP